MSLSASIDPIDLIKSREFLLEKTQEDFNTLSEQYPIPKPYLTYAGDNNMIIRQNVRQLLPRVKYEYDKGKFTADEVTPGNQSSPGRPLLSYDVPMGMVLKRRHYLS
jgi:hypothetical protein